MPAWKYVFFRFYKWLLKWSHNHHKKENKPLPKPYFHISRRSAPIYDNGSSLGRELTEEKVTFLLSSEAELLRYIDRGLAEIHWKNEKLTHFMLVQQLLDSEYGEVVIKIINRINQFWDGTRIESLLETIDGPVPETHAEYRLPKDRKALIVQILSLRRKRLVDLLHARI